MNNASPETILQADGKALTLKTTFARKTSVSIKIQATSDIVWKLLTEASHYPKWNSTIVSLSGNIKKDESIVLTSTLDEKRSFRLKVKEYEAPQQMIWGDSKGERRFQLRSEQDGSIVFHMQEKIGGLMFPLYAKYIPDFNASFEAFARDLKTEAERIHANQA